MLKKITLTFVSMLVMVSAATANDDLLTELASNKGIDVTDASVEVEDFDLDIDVDQLSDDASDEDATEACFRRFGYRSVGYRNWGYNYSSYRPAYRGYNCYRPVYRHPVYHNYSYHAPIVSHYWGCH